jgi:hypothetical protein
MGTRATLREAFPSSCCAIGDMRTEIENVIKHAISDILGNKLCKLLYLLKEFVHAIFHCPRHVPAT